MQVVVPPGMGLSSAYVTLSRGEASNLRDALDLMLATGSSGWHAYISVGGYETDVSLMLEMENPTDPSTLPGETTSG